MIILKNCHTIATFNDEGDELKGYDILIRGNVIEDIAKEIELPPDDEDEVEVIDCSHHLVMPGMVNTHHHLYQTLTRNLPGAQDAKLFDWLVYLYPIWARLDSEGVYYSTLLGCAELLKTGATTTTDHLYLYPKNLDADIMSVQFEAAERIGMRFAPSRGSMTLGRSRGGLPPDDVVQSTDEVLADMERVIAKFHDPSPFSMRRVILAPCSPFSVDVDLMRQTGELAREHNVVLHTHLAETEDEVIYCTQRYGKRPLALMEELGWLGEDVFFAHGIFFNDDELEVLRDTNTGVAHCPTSNMRLGSGIARVKEMLEMGIRVGLAVDGSASNDSSDMLGEVRNAMLLQRVRYGADAMTARQALRIATRGGASLLKFEKIGSIEKGMAADIAVFDVNKLQYAGALSDIVAAVVFTGYNHQTAYTIVNGRVVVRDGMLTTFSEEEITAKANEAARRMLEK